MTFSPAELKDARYPWYLAETSLFRWLPDVRLRLEPFRLADQVVVRVYLGAPLRLAWVACGDTLHDALTQLAGRVSAIHLIERDGAPLPPPYHGVSPFRPIFLREPDDE